MEDSEDFSDEVKNFISGMINDAQIQIKDTQTKNVETSAKFDMKAILIVVEQVSKEEKFKRYIKNLIINDDFYTDLMSDIKTEISNFKNKINSAIPKLVQDNVQLYLSSNIAKELNEQVPNYLNNNHQMQLILQNHKNKLELDLSQKLNDLVATIVNEEHYHTINKAYFDAFIERGNKQIDIFNQKSQNIMQNISDDGSKTIIDLKNQYNNEVGELKQNLNKTQELNLKINNLENELFYLKIGLAVGCIAIGWAVIFKKF